MRIALVSDIHGNRWALEAVLADAAARRVDALWNLGDILSGPLDPAATAARLIPLGLLTIAGNHERQLLDCQRSPGSASDAYAFARLSPAQLEWVRALPATARPASDIVLVHGTPESDLHPLLDSWPPGAPVRPATADELRSRLATVDERVRLVACGHTHVPGIVRLEDRLLVNPGSVGLQAFDYTDDDGERHITENGTPRASYAIVEVHGEGAHRHFEAHLLRVDYDPREPAALAEAAERHDWHMRCAPGERCPGSAAPRRATSRVPIVPSARGPGNDHAHRRRRRALAAQTNPAISHRLPPFRRTYPQPVTAP